MLTSKILELHRAGYNRAEIAKELKVSKSWVSRVITSESKAGQLSRNVQIILENTNEMLAMLRELVNLEPARLKTRLRKIEERQLREAVAEEKAKPPAPDQFVD